VKTTGEMGKVGCGTGDYLGRALLLLLPSALVLNKQTKQNKTKQKKTAR
jgi:hypothetical protein